MRHYFQTWLLALCLLMGLAACTAGENASDAVTPEATPEVQSLERPNIVLIMFEDMSARIGAFGDPVATTPILDAFAEESVLFPNTFTTAGICAPSRSSLITGVHQQALGTMHMRTRGYGSAAGGGPMDYDAVPAPDVKAFPEYLRGLGYHTSNNGKTDYQIGEPFTIWDHNSLTEPQWWSGREDGQPFFAMINIYETHESFLWPTDREPRNPMEAAVQGRNAQIFAGRAPVTDPASVEVPPYLPDTPIVRADIARQYDNIAFAERHVQAIMDRLEEDGLLDETIIILSTDHGDGLPRAKRSLYDSGLRVPMMVRFPDGRGAGTVNNAMISFLDLAPTILEIAGSNALDHMAGSSLLPDLETDRTYIRATLDRVDGFPERQKAVRDERYKYIRTYATDQAYFQQVAFRNSLPTMEEIWRLKEASELTEAQAFYHQVPRPRDELYDLEIDPHEVNNLAGDPDYAPVLQRLSSEMDRWIAEIGDLSALPETDMIARMWADMTQPVTATPTLTMNVQGLIEISSETEGASIGYRMTGDDIWQLYTGPFAKPDEVNGLEAKAQRYGFSESEVATLSLQ
ncbi:MAG: sulfatase [Pseudomonadota bacterium]